jgi:tetratricopeptide (TPR) repeat protein
MPTDAHYLVVSTSHPATLAAYDIYASDWIGHGPRVRSIFKAADEDPGCALVNAHAAAVHMALESAQGFKTARRYLTCARKAARDATAREQAFAKAVHDWWRGSPQSALKQLRAILSVSPHDIVTAKWAQYLAFNMGDAPAMLDVATAIMPAHRDTAEAWSMLAFAREQMNDLPLAEDAVNRALVLKPTDPWAHHAMAHVLEGQGRIDEGVAFLTARAAGWADRSIFVRGHNYWHLALLHLDRDEPKRALQIFDDHLWGTWPEFAQEQIGAISALWRLELRGADVGDRWRPVVARVIERWHEHILPFHDLHFVYALARAERRQEVVEFVASMTRHGEKDMTGVWDSLAVPCAKGLIAYAEGRFADAADYITPTLTRLRLVGGSHLQRDVFTQTWIDAALRAGRDSAVADVLARRASTRPAVKETHRLLKRARAAA